MLTKMRSAVLGKDNFEDVDIRSEIKGGRFTNASKSYYHGALVPVISGPSQNRFQYIRPEFLCFSEDEIALSSDQTTRPIICPKPQFRMPAYAGYAEVVNAGKSQLNEDQATATILKLEQQGCKAEEAIEYKRFRISSETKEGIYNMNLNRRLSDDNLISVPDEKCQDCGNAIVEKTEAAYFAIYDGHDGYCTAVMASKCLHEHIKARLNEVFETIIYLDRDKISMGWYNQASSFESNHLLAKTLDSCKSISCDSLVIGAIQAAFSDMDERIAEEKQIRRISDGCTAIVALFFLDKVYIANAGDCRALLVTSKQFQQFSQDFTPSADRKRIQYTAYKNPELISNRFTRLEYNRNLTPRDLKRKVLYRDWYMDGWAAKSVRESDLKPPLIIHRGRKQILLNTIGVSRCFGDHHLMIAEEKIRIKPFLSAIPDVKVLDINKLDSLCENDVLIIASDGLWDVMSNEDVARIVTSNLLNDSPNYLKYTLAAQELVAVARGNPTSSCEWKLSDGVSGSCDDISVFVIPLKYAIGPFGGDDDDEILR